MAIKEQIKELLNNLEYMSEGLTELQGMSEEWKELEKVP